MIDLQQKNETEEILDKLGENLSITETQHDAAVESYKAVGKWLTANDSELIPYNPVISPQGSFLIGTIIQTIDPDGDMDLDIVCELNGKRANWTQRDIKNIVGTQLSNNKTYESLLDDEGRRCWTLRYRENGTKNEKYHMDILPAVNTTGHSIILEKVFSNLMSQKYENLLLSITDNEMLPEFHESTEPREWLQSNPFGYAKWFLEKANNINGERKKLYSLNESINPTPKFQSDRLPLQRVVQLLKRHRDIFFKDHNDEDKKEKPISCIITTLAGNAYQGEASVYDAFLNIVFDMKNHIQNHNPHSGLEEKWVANPVNLLENFADRWRFPDSKRERFFYEWLDNLENDFRFLKTTFNRIKLSEQLENAFGSIPVKKTFSDIGNGRKVLTETGNNIVDRKKGLLGSAGIGATSETKIPKHTFYGKI